jgi:ATP-dependent RNA helicase DeaD
MPHQHLPSALAAALDARGYDTLTPVQTAAADPAAIGHDLIVSARTGSGKTVAFGLAMAPDLLDGDMIAFAEGPLALVIAPTRELALQVAKELTWLYADTGARIVTCVGGMDPHKERRALNAGASIVVGTPGRLRDHLERGALDLSSLKVAVLDEADEMLDMGFRDELEEILDATPEGRRTLLFSATMPRPIIALAKRYTKDAHRIDTLAETQGHADIAYQALAIAPADTENAVVNLLRLHEAETAILFCATREAVRRLYTSLNDRGFKAVALSGEMSQSERNQALQALRDKRARVCVATDDAARGIDLPSVTLVVHVELPRDAEALQHRSGRTGRAGRKGTAVLLVPFRARRRIEGLLRAAKIQADWIAPPTADDIRKQDKDRVFAQLALAPEADEDEAQFAGELAAALTPEAMALALARALRTELPAPEDILTGERPPRAPGDGPPPPREGFEDSVWFRINAGRRHNADPRWLLPTICRYGHLTRGEIGAIRIATHDSYFEVKSRSAQGFIKALRRAKIAPEDEGMVIEQAQPRGEEAPRTEGFRHRAPQRQHHRNKRSAHA